MDVYVTISNLDISSLWLVAFMQPIIVLLYFILNKKWNYLKRRHFIGVAFVVLLVANIIIGLLGNVKVGRVIEYSFWPTVFESIFVGLFWWFALERLNEN